NNIRDSADPTTGTLGLSFTEGGHNYFHDIQINNTGWSGFGLSGNENFDRVENVTIRHHGHNGVDLHPASNLLMSNIHIYDHVIGNDVLITGGTYGNPTGGARNVTLDHIYSTGGGIVAAINVSGLTITNSNIVDAGVGLGDTINTTLINVTVTNTTVLDDLNKNTISIYNLFGLPNVNTKIIDSSCYRLNSQGAVIDPVWLNVDYDINLYYNNNLSLYYYSDIIVQNNLRTPISNAEVIFDNDEEVSSVNAHTDNVASFYTNGMGRVPLPDSERTGSAAICGYHVDVDGTKHNLDHTATITTPDNQIITLPNITPDSTRYRADPNTPTYTITAIIPDSSTGPHITGFAPSENNPFNMADSKKFQVWTDEDLTTMEWYVDNELVSTGALEYTWVVPDEDGHTIQFEGSNANGAVSQNWAINGG
ncbi:MAG: hypothetical protein K8R64_03005, partial [Methanosarcinaceae archaeon]|nr:hypothetical protein [Methanosarcinaceae archaeon]